MEELVSGKGLGDPGDGKGPPQRLWDFDPGGAAGAPDAAVPLGPAGRQDMELDAQLRAGVLELSHELPAAVDLDESRGEGERRRAAFPKAHEEPFRQPSWNRMVQLAMIGFSVA